MVRRQRSIQRPPGLLVFPAHDHSTSHTESTTLRSAYFDPSARSFSEFSPVQALGVEHPAGVRCASDVGRVLLGGESGMESWRAEEVVGQAGSVGRRT